MKEKIRKIVFGLQNMLMMRKGVELNMNDEYCERFVWEACREEACFDLYEPSDEYDAWLGKSLMLYEKGWKYTLLFWVDVGLSCEWEYDRLFCFV